MADPLATSQIEMVVQLIRGNPAKSTELLAAFAEMTTRAATAKEASAAATAAIETAEIVADEARLAAERFAALIYVLRPVDNINKV